MVADAEELPCSPPRPPPPPSIAFFLPNILNENSFVFVTVGKWGRNGF